MLNKKIKKEKKRFNILRKYFKINLLLIYASVLTNYSQFQALTVKAMNLNFEHIESP